MESQTHTSQETTGRKGRKRSSDGVIGGAVAKSAERTEPSFDAAPAQADIVFNEPIDAASDQAVALAPPPVAASAASQSAHVTTELPPELPQELAPEQPPQGGGGAPEQQPPKKRRSRIKPALLLLLLMLLSLAAWWAVDESRTSAMQAKFFSEMAKKISWKVEKGPSNAIRFPSDSPYDERLGYANLADYLAKLKSHDYVVTAQSRMSPKMVELADIGVFSTYREKTRVGLDITDAKPSAHLPGPLPRARLRQFRGDPAAAGQEPAVHRKPRAARPDLSEAQSGRRVGPFQQGRVRQIACTPSPAATSASAGGSTLATQIEKYRHSPDGRTSSLKDKLRQMCSATLRAYQGGEDTTKARRQIVVDYINTVPLSAKLGYGEVNGIGDGMWVWYGRDFADRQQRLEGQSSTRPMRALVYKEALSLFIAQRRPAHYLGAGANDLEELTNTHLRVLAPGRRHHAAAARPGHATQKLHPASGTGVAPPAANSFTHAQGGQRRAHPPGRPAGRHPPVQPRPPRSVGGQHAERAKRKRPSPSACAACATPKRPPPPA